MAKETEVPELDSGLRQRRGKPVGAACDKTVEKLPAESNCGTTKSDMGKAHGPPVAQSSPPSAVSGFSGRVALAVICLLVGGIIGAGLGVVQTLVVMGTEDYPFLEAQLEKMIQFLDLNFVIHMGEDEEIISCTDDQPLVERTQDTMAPEMFSRMQECLIGHPMIQSNPLNPDGFSGTRGFVIKFGLEKGVERFRQETDFNCGDFHPLVPFFDRARHPEANGFVMNVLVCDKPSNKSGLVVGTHVDNTLGHTRSGADFLAHTVSVLYLNVPKDMEGGELEILGTHEDAYGGIEDEDEEPTPQEIIPPVENSYAEFRGDAYHQVRGYDTLTDTLRVSLVLEQYKLSEDNERYLIQYERSEKDGMTMM